MNHAELYRRARNGDYKELVKLNEFEQIRFIAYLLGKIRDLEEKANEKI